MTTDDKPDDFRDDTGPFGSRSEAYDTPDTPVELRHRIHMAMLAKSESAKDCGELTVIPIGFAVTVAQDLIKAELTSLLGAMPVEQQCIGRNCDDTCTACAAVAAHNQVIERVTAIIEQRIKETL